MTNDELLRFWTSPLVEVLGRIRLRGRLLTPAEGIVVIVCVVGGLYVGLRAVERMRR